MEETAQTSKSTKATPLVWYDVLSTKDSIYTGKPYCTGFYRLLNVGDFGYVTVERVDHQLKERKEITINTWRSLGRESRVSIFPHPSGDYFVIFTDGYLQFYNSEGETVAAGQESRLPWYSFEPSPHVSFLPGNRIVLLGRKVGAMILEDFNPTSIIYKDLEAQEKAEKTGSFFSPKELEVLGFGNEFLLEYCKGSHSINPLFFLDSEDDVSSSQVLLSEKVGEYEIVLIQTHLGHSSCELRVTLIRGGKELEEEERSSLDPSILDLWQEYRSMITKNSRVFGSSSAPISDIFHRKNDSCIVLYILTKTGSRTLLMTILVMDRRTRRTTLIAYHPINSPPIVLLKGRRVTLFRKVPLHKRAYTLTPKEYDDFVHDRSHRAHEISCYEPVTLWSPQKHRKFLPRFREYFFQIFLCLYGYKGLPVELACYIMKMVDKIAN